DECDPPAVRGHRWHRVVRPRSQLVCEPARRGNGRQREAVVAPVGEVALEDDAPPVWRPDRARVPTEILTRGRNREAAQATSVRTHRVEAADAPALDRERDPATAQG